MNWRAKHFFQRRRWDGWVLALAGAAVPLRHGITPILSVFFSVVGIYLVAINHRGARALAPWFVSLAVTYLLWSLFLIILRTEPVFDNRQVTYSLLIGALGFLANGLILVRDPVRKFVIGSRIGVVVAALAAISFSFLGEYRVGLGGNPAPFAMAAAICMIAAIVPVGHPPRWAPNSLLYAVVGAIPIYFSETRALLVIVPLVLVVEYAFWLSCRSLRLKILGTVAGFLVGFGAILLGPVHNQIERVFVPVILYYTGHVVEWNGASGDIRLALWQGAAAAISEHPLSGYGKERMQNVVSHAPPVDGYPLSEFRHVHNMFLDEVLLHGLPGLTLLLGLLVAGFWHILKYSGDAAIRRNTLYFLASMLSYGSLHNPFLHESTICGIFLYMGVMIAGAARNKGCARVLQSARRSVTASAPNASDKR